MGKWMWRPFFKATSKGPLALPYLREVYFP